MFLRRFKLANFVKTATAQKNAQINAQTIDRFSTKILAEIPAEISENASTKLPNSAEADETKTVITGSWVSAASIEGMPDNTAEGEFEVGHGLGSLQDGDRPAKLKKQHKSQRGRLGWPVTIALAGALIVGVRLWVADVFVMRSPAMDPTLSAGDRVVVDKLSYRWRSPERGEILAFDPPPILLEMRPQANQPFLLRVVGVPGDRLWIKEGKLYVNGEPLAEPYLQELATYEMAEVKIPDGTYFVLGDNRNDSFDSSIWGIVPANKVIGRAASVMYPFDKLQGL